VHGQNSRTRRAFRTLCFAVFLTVGATALAGCEEAQPDTPDTFEYVAVGDSFTAAGIGIPKERTGCKRSPLSYPNLIAADRPDITLVDASCGGASTENVLEAQDFDGSVNPPQFSDLSEGTDLVTVSLGGNDYDIYWDFLYRCVQLRQQDPDGHPCRTVNKGKPEKKMPRIRANLAEALEAAGDLAPNARVMMVGYPRLLPDEGACRKRVPVADGDVDYVRKMMGLLVEAQKGAAEDAGVEHVDVWEASEGHDVCSDEPWVNDVKDGPEGAHEFHPMPEHQRAVADLILAKLS
jgi:hypothetical protein